MAIAQLPTRTIAQNIIDVIIPPRCVACNGAVEEQGKLCLDCWSDIRFITAPMCHCCGLPFEYAMGAEVICGVCAAETPSYAMARAAFRYDDASRNLVTSFKFSDRTYKAPAFGEMLQRAGREFWDVADVLVPVPLHRRRLLSRRYNQAALLARAASFATGKPAVMDGLMRTKYTMPQTGLNSKARSDNVRGAFIVRPHHKEAMRGKSVVLIDDVLTTGATIRACSKALLRAGVKQVFVLTLARALIHDA